MAVTGESPTFVSVAGQRATRSVANVDDIEPEFVGFVRTAVRWLDPRFPQTGQRGQGVHGSWTDDEQVETEVVQFEELAKDGRGVRIMRLYRLTPPDGPYEGSVRVIAVGVADGARLELRWNFIASESEVRGTSAELTVHGARQFECIEDFRSWFETGGN